VVGPPEVLAREARGAGSLDQVPASNAQRDFAGTQIPNVSRCMSGCGRIA